jgi:hypothetical protein
MKASHKFLKLAILAHKPQASDRRISTSAWDQNRQKGQCAGFMPFVDVNISLA